nr:hypothetical protein [Tanacetum cinerariifolium]
MSHIFLRLKEGGIYSVKNFAVKPNMDEYRNLKNDAYMLEFDGSKIVRKASVMSDGFVRYPFQLQDFNDIELSDNKYLTDVAGYVTNVGRTNHLKSGSKNLDFHLANHSVVDHQTSRTSIDLSQPWARTLENLLILSPSTVRSPLMQSGQGRDGTSLHVGATPEKGFDSSERPILLPIVYRLEVDVSDNTAQAVVVMFNEIATSLVNCSADSLIDTVDEILPSEGIEDSVGSNNLDNYPDHQPQKLKRIVQDPSIGTPSKHAEEIKMPSDSANATWKKGDVKPSAKKRKNRIVYDETDSA